MLKLDLPVVVLVLSGEVALISAALDLDAAVADIKVDLGLGAVADVFISLSIALLKPVCMA